MQTRDLDLNLLFLLAFLVLCLAVLICVYNITRPRGIYNAFQNEEGAELNMAEAEIRAEEISGAFNNKNYAKQIHTKAKFGRGESSNAANPEAMNPEPLQIEYDAAKLIKYLCGEKQLPYKDKSN